MSIAALIVSIASVIVAMLALYKNWIDSRASTRENDFRARQQYNAEVRSWAAGCTKALSDAVYLAARGCSDQELQYRVISALSALLEQGRLFFPNITLSSVSTPSEILAREGWRPRILDWLAYALRICAVTTPDCDPEAEEVLKKLQAGFTSDVQFVLNPRDLRSKMSDLPKLLRSGEFMDPSQTCPEIVRARSFFEQRKNSRSGEKIHPSYEL